MVALFLHGLRYPHQRSDNGGIHEAAIGEVDDDAGVRGCLGQRVAQSRLRPQVALAMDAHDRLVLSARVLLLGCRRRGCMWWEAGPTPLHLPSRTCRAASLSSVSGISTDIRLTVRSRKRVRTAAPHAYEALDGTQRYVVEVRTDPDIVTVGVSDQATGLRRTKPARRSARIVSAAKSSSRWVAVPRSSTTGRMRWTTASS